MKYLVLFIALLMTVNIQAQKKPLVESQEEVKQLASAEFSSSMTGPEGELYLFGTENSIEGTYSFKVTIGDRGKVVSIFVLNREGGSVQMQNNVKDAVKLTRFEFKVPKDKSYSLEYSFKF